MCVVWVCARIISFDRNCLHFNQNPKTKWFNKKQKQRQHQLCFFSNVAFKEIVRFGSRKYLNLSTGLGLSVYIRNIYKNENNCI